MVNFKKLLLKTTILVLLFSFQNRLFAKNLVSPTDSISIAIKLFENEEYKKALPLFEHLLQNNPDNKLLNYYYGATLVENGIFNESTNNSLLRAVSGNTPDKVLYYVGLMFKNKELWNSAIKYFKLFCSISTNEKNEKLGVDDLLDECKGKLVPKEEIQQDTLDNDKPIVDSTINDIYSLDTMEVIIENNEEEVEKVKEEPKQVIVKTNVIDFQINSIIAYCSLEHFKNEDAKNFFLSGEKYSIKLDSVIQKSDSLRTTYQNATTIDERNRIAQKIIKAEGESMTLNSEHDNSYAKARELEIRYWEQASKEEINSFIEEVEKSKQESNIDNKPEASLVILDSFSEIDPSILFYDRIVKQEEENKEEDKLIYKVQIGAYSRGLPAYMERLYKKLSLIRKIDNYTDEKGIVVYTTGRLTNFEDAMVLQKQVRIEGIKDAFVVPYLNGKRITIKEAKGLSK